MNTHKETESGSEIHESVRSAYRAIAVEIPSEEIDQNLMREATRSVSYSNFSPFAWIRPAALTAVVVLGLGILFQFNLKSVPGSIDQYSGEQANPNATDELTEAVEITGQRLRELDRAAERLLPANKSAPGAAKALGPDQERDSRSDRSCDSEMTRTPAAWWACIEELNRTGKAQSARAELELLEAEFPGYNPAR